MYQKFDDGWLEVISGCMFAGKSEEIIRRVKVLQFARKNIKVFKPIVDNRYSLSQVVSHDGSKVEAVAVEKASQILDSVDETTDVVIIDEVQFFDDDIVEVCQILTSRKINVIAVGLDLDFRGEPFGPMPKLLTLAEFVTKLTAICSKCGGTATRTQRIIDGIPASYDDPIVLIGASEKYEARCRKCHEVLNKPKYKLGR